MAKGEANRLRREMERVEGERERLREEARRWVGRGRQGGEEAPIAQAPARVWHRVASLMEVGTVGACGCVG